MVVVAEGAGQELMSDEQTGTDASGNRKLGDIGRFLEAAIVEHYRSIGRELTLKYLKPGYSIRSVPAKAHDSVYCVRLAQAAAHAGMAGRTDMVVGRRHNRFVHVPIDIVVSPAQRGRARRRPVAQRAGIDGSAAGDALRSDTVPVSRAALPSGRPSESVDDGGGQHLVQRR